MDPEHPEAYYYKALAFARLQGTLPATQCLAQARDRGLPREAVAQLSALLPHLDP